MEALKVLVKEHVKINECLNLLSTAGDKILKNEGPPKEFFSRAMRFCSEFADKYHHYKEEHVMFNYLAQKHNGEIDGQIESHRNQHEQCRDLIRKIEGALEGYEQKQNEPTRMLHSSVVEYCQTLRSHIKSENEVFFPMANKILDDSDDKNLMVEFVKYEKKVGEDVDQANFQLLSEMKAML